MTFESMAGNSTVKLLLVPFPFTVIMYFCQTLTTKKTNKQANKQKQKLFDIFLLKDTHTDKHLLLTVYFHRGGCLALYYRSTRCLKCNLSTTLSISPSLLETAVTERISPRKKKTQKNKKKKKKQEQIVANSF